MLKTIKKENGKKVMSFGGVTSDKGTTSFRVTSNEGGIARYLIKTSLVEDNKVGNFGTFLLNKPTFAEIEKRKDVLEIVAL